MRLAHHRTTQENHEYQATIIENHDGDTSKISADLGFGISAKITVRWLGINAPELSTPEGKTARDALNVSKEKYGRYLATFTLADGTNVNDWLVKSGYAVPYDGGKR
jgi:endonuclease YncB( thermonuclease family)